MRKASGLAGLAAVALFAPACLSGQALKVLHPSGAEHGFLVLQDTAGKVLASGELTQTLYNNNIKLRVVFQFRDGSVDDETTVFSQEGTFHLETDQHTQKGPSFPHPSYMVVDTRKQQVSVRDLSKDKLPVSTEHMVLPPDVANGLLFVLIQNLQANKPIEVPFVAFTPQATHGETGDRTGRGGRVQGCRPCIQGDQVRHQGAHRRSGRYRRAHGRQAACRLSRVVEQEQRAGCASRRRPALQRGSGMEHPHGEPGLVTSHATWNDQPPVPGSHLHPVAAMERNPMQDWIAYCHRVCDNTQQPRHLAKAWQPV